MPPDGTVFVVDGQLWEISNNGGHYYVKNHEWAGNGIEGLQQLKEQYQQFNYQQEVEFAKSNLQTFGIAPEHPQYDELLDDQIESNRVTFDMAAGFSGGIKIGGKVVSALTSGAKGAGNLKPQNLMDELSRSGVKYNPNDVAMVTKTADGKLLWLETGNASAGLKHIVIGHAADFTAKGISDIPGFLKQTLQSKPIKTGTGAGGPFADYMVNGNAYRVAYGTNGFIVSFYPIS